MVFQEQVCLFKKDFLLTHSEQDYEFIASIFSVLGDQKGLYYLFDNVINSTVYSIEDFISLYEKGNKTLNLIFNAAPINS